jgi:hypothetical protein
MKRAVRSRTWKTAGIALIVAAFGLFSYPMVRKQADSKWRRNGECWGEFDQD